MLETQIELQKRGALLQLVSELKSELHKQRLWLDNKPSDLALSSSAPFAVDSLTFVQWLQFIFIHKMEKLLHFSQPLPSECCILPMATEQFKNLSVAGDKILNLLGRIDLLISEKNEQ